MSKWSDIAFGQPVGSRAVAIARALNLGMAALEPVNEDVPLFADAETPAHDEQGLQVSHTRLA